jgi:NTP pyrophosphatase (non-canonical NTP hydrolase)
VSNHTEQQRCPTCKSPDREVFLWSIASGEGCNWSNYDPWHKGSATEPTPTQILSAEEARKAGIPVPPDADSVALYGARVESGATAQTAPKEKGMKFSNELTDSQLERLAILSEEMGEAQQAIGKILRHGYESHNPDVPKAGWSNRHDLEKELGDVLFAVEMLWVSLDVSGHAVHQRKIAKSDKIKPYLHHQEPA